MVGSNKLYILINFSLSSGLLNKDYGDEQDELNKVDLNPIVCEK